MRRKFNFFAWVRGERPARQRRSRGTTRQRLRWAVLFVSVAVLLGLCFLGNVVLRDGEEHPHDRGPHGGNIVAVSRGEPHYHAEAVVEENGILSLYVFGEETLEALAVETQFLTPKVRAEGDAEAVEVILRPLPQRGDPGGKTSRFAGKLPIHLLGKRLVAEVLGIIIAAQHFPIRFHFDSGPRGAFTHALEWEKELLLKPGGMYTAADIRAVGGVTASEKFHGVRVIHDLQPRKGDRLCPVTHVKSNPKFSWAVSGKTYQFCCPPCIAEFVSLAKSHPEKVQDPKRYEKKE